MNLFDLQIQSTCSDGKHAPREIVAMAKKLGMHTIALTDHDTVVGVPEALLVGSELGIRVIPGIEMSVEEHGAHILGFGIDYKNAALEEKLESARTVRVERAKKLVENLQKNEDFTVEWGDVLREAGGAATVASPHIVGAVMARPENKEKLAEDGVLSKGDFYKNYLRDDGPNHVKRPLISGEDAIALLHGAGGVAVWSHPAIHFFENYEGLENFLKELVGWGIDGIEVFTPSHTEDDMEFLEGMSQKYNLLRTAGSDFHDSGEHPRSERGLHSADTLGDYETYGFSTDGIISALDEAIEKRRR